MSTHKLSTQQDNQQFIATTALIHKRARLLNRVGNFRGRRKFRAPTFAFAATFWAYLLSVRRVIERVRERCSAQRPLNSAAVAQALRSSQSIGVADRAPLGPVQCRTAFL